MVLVFARHLQWSEKIMVFAKCEEVGFNVSARDKLRPGTIFRWAPPNIWFSEATVREQSQESGVLL